MNREKWLKVSAILLALVTLISVSAITVAARSPNKTLGPPSYVLNILGKKSGWEPEGGFDNPDRHTILVPEDASGSDPGTYGNLSAAGSVLIWMTGGPEFAVLDGNACDDGNASLQVENGRWNVYVVALGKPGGEGTLKGWYYDDEGNACYLLGTVKNLRRSKGVPVWMDATDIFYITWAQLTALGFTDDWLLEHGFVVGEPVWIFDFLKFLYDVYGDTDYYFWQLTNQGLKHIQVRFYPA